MIKFDSIRQQTMVSDVVQNGKLHRAATTNVCLSDRITEEMTNTEMNEASAQE
ncbi:hypothetical protein PT286_01955 [Neisseriaceae bacterium ESL0693]|nr:hypothetical protein [Neisseriaceae bacterium ESL0693]